VTLDKKGVATLLSKHIVILCDFSPFPLLQSKVHVFLQVFLTYVLSIDIHQRSVVALKASEDARVKKKACSTDIEEEIRGSKYAPDRMALTHARWCQDVLSLLCCVIFWLVDMYRVRQRIRRFLSVKKIKVLDIMRQLRL